MGYNLTSIAAQSPLESTLEAVRAFATEKGWRFEEISPQFFNPKSIENCRVGTRDGWTVIAFPVIGFGSQLPRFLSKALKTKVIFIDEYETVGEQHVAVLESGVPLFIYTFFDGEIKYSLNANPEQLITQAVREKGYAIPSHRGKEDYPYLLFDVFNQYLSPINAEEGAISILKDPQSSCYRLASQL